MIINLIFSLLKKTKNHESQNSKNKNNIFEIIKKLKERSLKG